MGTRGLCSRTPNMGCLQQSKQVFAMVATSFSLAVVNILLKKVLNEGMYHLLIIMYRQMVSAIFLTPMAYIWESALMGLVSRSVPNLVSFYCFEFFLEPEEIFAVTTELFCVFARVTLTQYLFLLGLKFTSATYSCAFINMVPVMTFIMALPFGLEKVSIRSKSGRAKLLGALICVGGALLLSLYKGIPLRNITTVPEIPKANDQFDGRKKWGTGTLLLTSGSLMWSSWFLIQAKIGKIYPCQYSSTAMISFFSALQSVILCVIIGRNISSWVVKGKLEILSVLYAGMVGSGLCYVVMSWCVKERGPVFTSAFSPFIQIFVAAFDVTFLHEQIHLGSVLGSLLVILGMYILLWGKIHEAAELSKIMKPDSGQIEEGNEGHFQVSSLVPVTVTQTSV